jgi:hypothetical protein
MWRVAIWQLQHQLDEAMLSSYAKHPIRSAWDISPALKRYARNLRVVGEAREYIRVSARKGEHSGEGEGLHRAGYRRGYSQAFENPCFIFTPAGVAGSHAAQAGKI